MTSDETPEPRTEARSMACPKCGDEMRFVDGRVQAGLYAERYRCTACGEEAFRSVGRGSI